MAGLRRSRRPKITIAGHCAEPSPVSRCDRANEGVPPCSSSLPFRWALWLQPERPADDLGCEDAAVLLLRRLLRPVPERERARSRLEQDRDPASSSDFCQYAIDFGAELPDYPKLGDSSHFLLFGYNLFGSFASTYEGSAFITLNKPPAGTTCPDTSAFSVQSSGVLRNADGSGAATPVPANLVDDSSGVGYVVANADLTDSTAHPSGADFVSVYTVTTSGTDANGVPIASISGPRNVTVPTYQMPSNAPERDSPYLLDTLDGRFEAAVAAADPQRQGRIGLWTAHAVFGGAGAEERWYEIDPGGSALFQAGTATSGSLFVWNGAISPDLARQPSSATAWPCPSIPRQLPPTRLSKSSGSRARARSRRSRVSCSQPVPASTRVAATRAPAGGATTPARVPIPRLRAPSERCGFPTSTTWRRAPRPTPTGGRACSASGRARIWKSAGELNRGADRRRPVGLVLG